MTDRPSQTMKTRDGTSLSYRLEKGQGAGRCVLIHSLAMDMNYWDSVVPLLLPHADVLVYDCRGHGRSDKPDQAYTVERFADDLADLMDAVGWDKAVLSGASMGGTVAIAFAAAYPERTAGLGLFDTTEWYGENAPAAWEERAEKARQGGMEALIGFQKSRWFGDRFREENPEIVDKAIAVFLANDVTAYGHTCRMLGSADKRDALPGFAFPVEILVGSEDYATPIAMAESMQAAIPGAKLEVAEGARHFTPLEIPETVAGKVAALVEAANR